MKHRVSAIVVIVVVAFGALLWGRAQSQDGEAVFMSSTQQIMSAPVTVVAPASRAAEAAEIVFGIFGEIDTTMSEWKPGSPLSAVNRAAGLHPVKVPADLLDVLRRGIAIGDLTEGAFDITWASLWGLWDFNAEHPQLPGPEDIQPRIDLINFREIRISDDASTVYLPRSGMVIGLGGIAKGTALNRSAAALQARGINDFLISAGGHVIFRGARGDRPWRVGIRDPRGAIDDYFARLELSDTSVSTSGDYERFLEINGIRYHHILDPRTGMPSRGLRSATVICPDAEFADALSTALMILGPQEAFALAERLPSVEVVLVDDEGRVNVSDGVGASMTIRHPPAP
jgi:thiamine biosynthesis lipoprotein